MLKFAGFAGWAWSQSLIAVMAAMVLTVSCRPVSDSSPSPGDASSLYNGDDAPMGADGSRRGPGDTRPTGDSAMPGNETIPGDENSFVSGDTAPTLPPQITAVLASDASPIWDSSAELAGYAIIGDEILLSGAELDCGSARITDKVSTTRTLDCSLVDMDSVLVGIPWDLTRVDLAIYFTTAGGISRVEITLLAIDETSRQLFVNGVTNQTW